jgi:hypothetical protein
MQAFVIFGFKLTMRIVEFKIRIEYFVLKGFTRPGKSLFQ